MPLYIYKYMTFLNTVRLNATVSVRGKCRIHLFARKMPHSFVCEGNAAFICLRGKCRIHLFAREMPHWVVCEGNAAFIYSSNVNYIYFVYSYYLVFIIIFILQINGNNLSVMPMIQDLPVSYEIYPLLSNRLDQILQLRNTSAILKSLKNGVFHVHLSVYQRQLLRFLCI